MKRGPSRWRAELCIKGKRQSATFLTAAQARAWAAMKEGEVADGRAGILPTKTVRQALERYAAEVSPGHRGLRWERVRLTKLAREIPFADKAIANVSPADVAGWRDAQALVLAPASIRREYGLLRAVFGVARREWGWLRSSPFESVKAPPAGAPRTRRVSDAELDAIIKALGWDRTSPPARVSHYIAAASLWALETAMRQGEILGLEAEAVDVEARVARLTKTKNGDDREVPLSRAALALLDILPKRGRLFPVASGSFDTLWRAARARAKAEGIHFHDLRREATTRLAAKLDVMMLAKVTGHRDVKVLLKTYYAPSMSKVAALLD